MKTLIISRKVILAMIIPGLISGPFLPDLTVSVSSLIFLYFIFKNKEFYFFKKKSLIIFFIFCLYCILLSIFIAKDAVLSLEASLFYFRIGVFSCVIWYLIDRDKEILDYFYFTLVFCFSALVLDGYLQYFTAFNIIGLPASGLRISSFLVTN